jgi:hypothetical protein
LDSDEEVFDLDAEDKALFLKTWDLNEGELTDEQILLAIRLGHL